MAADEQKWWEQRCPVCDQHFRFVRTRSRFGNVEVPGYTDPDQGNRSLPVDPGLMAQQIERERDAA